MEAVRAVGKERLRLTYHLVLESIGSVKVKHQNFLAEGKDIVMVSDKNNGCVLGCIYWSQAQGRYVFFSDKVVFSEDVLLDIAAVLKELGAGGGR